MKKIYSIVILLSIGITQIYAQCYQCNNTAFMIGTGTIATGQNSFVGGNTSFVSGNNAFAFGDTSQVFALNGIALGDHANVLQANGIAIGNFVTSNAANSYVFGMGSSSSAFLTNSKPNSLMFGVSDLPTLTIVKPDGADRGFLGVGTDTPTEMAHVIGKLLIERTETTPSSLQFKHPNTGKDISPPGPTPTAYYWDIYSDTKGLKFNTAFGLNPTIAQLMVLDRNGYLGIGVENPLAKLHVNQNIIAEGDITTFNKWVLAPNNDINSDRWEISRTDNGLNYAYFDKSLEDILFIGADGNIGIGKTNPSAMLDVNGSLKAATADISGALSASSATIANNATITGTLTANLLSAPNAKIAGLLCAEEVRVQHGLPCWPDFVFKKDYTLTPLNELEQFITENQHLPNVPSAVEVEANGVELGEMNALLLQKVEELTLYIIQMQKQIDELKNAKP
jgi:hypothetical protein